MTQSSLKRYQGIAKSWNQFLSSGYIEIMDPMLMEQLGTIGNGSAEVFTPAASIEARHGERRLNVGEEVECSVILRGFTWMAINVEFPESDSSRRSCKAQTEAETGQ